MKKIKTSYNNSLFGKNYSIIKEIMRANGYIYHVSYNNTENLFVFKDKFFKYKKSAEKFHNKMLSIYGKSQFEVLN